MVPPHRLDDEGKGKRDDSHTERGEETGRGEDEQIERF
jgi:hypothetical protein